MNIIATEFITNSTVNVQFSIKGKGFSHTEITELLGLTPTKCFNMGDRIGSTESIGVENAHRCTSWEIETGFQKSWDVTDQIDIIMDMLKGKHEMIRSLPEKYDAEPVITVVIHVVGCDKPAIYMNKEIVDFLTDIGAEIEFDYYIPSDVAAEEEPA